MKVLVLEQTLELAELMGIYLSGLSSNEVKTTHLTQEAVQLIEQNDFAIFLCNVGFAAPGADLAIKTWQKKSAEAPLVLLGDRPVPKEYDANVKVSHIHMVQELKELVKSPMWRKLEGKPMEHPLPLSPYLIYRLGICPADLFLKLGDNNWVKLFHKGSPFGEVERGKFEAKGLKEFWVLPEDIGQALGHFEDLLGALTADDRGDEALVSDATEFIWHMVNESGFREDIQRVVKVATQQALNVVKNNPDLSQFIDKVFRPEHGHLVRHSMVTAHIACAIATELGWTSEQTYLKLTVASMMHDILLPKFEGSEEVWMEALAGGAKNQVSNHPDMKAFLQHSVEGAQLLRRFRDIPPDTDKIVLEHHEQPDGSGFPRGLTSSQISPLGCLFILSHAAAERLLKLKEDKKEWSLPNLLESMDPDRWQSGNFKKIWQTFEKTALFK